MGRGLRRGLCLPGVLRVRVFVVAFALSPVLVLAGAASPAYALAPFPVVPGGVSIGGVGESLSLGSGASVVTDLAAAGTAASAVASAATVGAAVLGVGVEVYGVYKVEKMFGLLDGGCGPYVCTPDGIDLGQTPVTIVDSSVTLSNGSLHYNYDVSIPANTYPRYQSLLSAALCLGDNGAWVVSTASTSTPNIVGHSEAFVSNGSVACTAAPSVAGASSWVDVGVVFGLFTVSSGANVASSSVTGQKVYVCQSPVATGVYLLEGCHIDGSGVFAGSDPYPPPADGSTVKRFRYRVEEDCVASSGVTSVVNLTSASFTASTSSQVSMPVASCGAGAHPYRYRVWLDNITDLIPGTTPLVDWQQATGDSDPTSLDDPNAGCLAGSGSTPCLLKLDKLSSTGTWLSCNDGQIDCSAWTDPAPVDTSQWQCVWGAAVVALANCDPFTGDFTPPAPQDTGTGTPTEGVNPDPGDGSNCLSAAWSWNPVDWVYVPVKCALSWAFDPGSDYLSQKTAQLQTAWDSSVFGQVAAVVGNVGGSIVHDPGGTASDCAGPSFDVGHVWQLGDGQYLYRPLYACDGFGKTVHDFAEPFILVFLWLAAFWTSYQYLVKSIGMADL